MPCCRKSNTDQPEMDREWELDATLRRFLGSGRQEGVPAGQVHHILPSRRQARGSGASGRRILAGDGKD